MSILSFKMLTNVPYEMMRWWFSVKWKFHHAHFFVVIYFAGFVVITFLFSNFYCFICCGCLNVYFLLIVLIFYFIVVLMSTPWPPCRRQFCLAVVWVFPAASLVISKTFFTRHSRCIDKRSLSRRSKSSLSTPTGFWYSIFLKHPTTWWYSQTQINKVKLFYYFRLVYFRTDFHYDS